MTKKGPLCGLGLAFIALFTTSVIAKPEYATIKMQIDVAKPAAEVWAKVGKYCDISQWLKEIAEAR